MICAWISRNVMSSWDHLLCLESLLLLFAYSKLTKLQNSITSLTFISCNTLIKFSFIIYAISLQYIYKRKFDKASILPSSVKFTVSSLSCILQIKSIRLFFSKYYYKFKNVHVRDTLQDFSFVTCIDTRSSTDWLDLVTF